MGRSMVEAVGRFIEGGLECYIWLTVAHINSSRRACMRQKAGFVLTQGRRIVEVGEASPEPKTNDNCSDRR
jgi:deoxycytidylate deaminase